MAWVARVIERDETAGLMKLVVMLAGAPYTLPKGAVYLHPTLAEGPWTLMEAVTAV